MIFGSNCIHVWIALHKVQISRKSFIRLVVLVALKITGLWLCSIKDYRPMAKSLCSVVGKLERAITRNVVEYMQTSELISPQQHRFMSGRSCTTLLTKVCHYWMQILYTRSPPDVDIFLDWSKAFDKVSYSILLSKLHKYGICGSLWCWISSFLVV